MSKQNQKPQQPKPSTEQRKINERNYSKKSSIGDSKSDINIRRKAAEIPIRPCPPKKKE
ncbi:MAG: hypothetical protein ACOCWG_05910 [bacterium]